MPLQQNTENGPVLKSGGPHLKDQALMITLLLIGAKGKAISVKDISEKLGLAPEEILKLSTQFDEEKIFSRTRDDAAIIVPSGEERLKMAVKAVTLGARIEEVARNLSWNEFEWFCTRVLEENGYTCIHGLRFKSSKGKRYECDIVGLSKPILLLADCKHYSGKVKGLHAVVEKQVERANALSKSIPDLMRHIPQLASWQQIIIVPLIITLFPESIAFIDSVPVVPAFKLNQFIQELPANIDSVKHSDAMPPKQKRLL